MSAMIKRILTKYLESDEELISVERMQTRTPVVARALTLGMSNLANRDYFVGLTDSRLIIVPLSRMGGWQKKNDVFSIKFNDIEIKNDKLLICPKGKYKPIKFHFMSGIKAFTKLDKNEFLYQLEKKQAGRD